VVYDFKKEFKQLYTPKTTPSIVDVPEMTFIMVDGKGNPNTSAEYQAAISALYTLSYSIKMSKMGSEQPEGYFDFVVPPLEGLWQGPDGGVIVDITDKDSFHWTSMIRVPDFVTPEVFEQTRLSLAEKRSEVDLSIARLQKFTEGLSAHIMHIGPYDDEPKSTSVLEQFIEESGYVTDFTCTRRHHEIYLGDPRRVAPEKLKTIIRYPIAFSGE